MRAKKVGYEFGYADFAHAMKQARKGRGMTLKTVAQVLKKSQATISRYESAKVAPTLPDFLAICLYYDFKPFAFLFADKEVEKTIAMFDSAVQEGRIA